METKHIQIDIPGEILIALNETEQEFKIDMKVYTAIWLYIKEKLTIGKAAQLAGMERIEFETILAKNKIPISLLTYETVKEDAKKIKECSS